MLTRIRGAIVDVILAVWTGEANQTLARVPVQPIDAGASVLTRIGSAFVNVDFAAFS